jgi:hypothetical protein
MTLPLLIAVRGLLKKLMPVTPSSLNTTPLPVVID